MGKTIKGVNLKKSQQIKEFAFLKSKGLRRYMIAILKLTGVNGQRQSNLILSLIPIIQTHWKNSGVTWITKYWGEVFRYVIAYLNGEVLVDGKFWVQRTRSGLPKCLPLPIRKIIIQFKRDPHIYKDIMRSILSALNFYRACSGHHKVNLSSISSVKTGVIDSFNKRDLKLVLKSMGVNKIRFLSKPKYFISEKAGVNANHSFISIGWDFIALTLNPKVFIAHLEWCVHYRYYFHFTYMIVLLIILTPIIMLYKLGYILNFDNQLFLGRLAVIKEARQKARVVGITDWWTQVLFKPLHDKLADILRDIPEDGTFDQLAPVKKMLEVHKNGPIVSSDLSNATDRLPVKLQADILSSLGIKGDLWQRILNRSYFHNHPKPGIISYAVGQPMGVYSSFVMLSLTNHILNGMASLRAGLSCSKGSHVYSVLGDDVASRDPHQAKFYVELLTQLGVTVNPIKGFNGRICEFAKRLYFNTGQGEFLEISPVGAKVILQAITNPMYAVAVLADMSNKNYSLEYAVSLLSNYLTALFKRGRTPGQMVACQTIHLFTLLGPQSGLYNIQNSKDKNNLFYLNFVNLLNTFGLKEEEFFSVLTERSLNLWAKPHDILAVSKDLIIGLFNVSVLTKQRVNDFTFLSDSLELSIIVNEPYKKVNGFVQVLVTTLLVSITGFPILIKGLVEKYFNFLILEFSTRDTLKQAGGTQLSIIKSVTKRLSPQSFQDLNILDKIDMAMFGRIPFLVSYIPFNVLINKLKVFGVIDQMPAIKIAIAFLKEKQPVLYKDYISYLKELRNEKKGRNKSGVKNKKFNRKKK